MEGRTTMQLTQLALQHNLSSGELKKLREVHSCLPISSSGQGSGSHEAVEGRWSSSGQCNQSAFQPWHADFFPPSSLLLNGLCSDVHSGTVP